MTISMARTGAAIKAVLFAATMIVVSLASHGAWAEAKTRSFHADLSPDEEPKVTPSGGSGALDITVDLSNLSMVYRVVLNGLKSEVTGIHLHGPCGRGDIAPAILDLAPLGIRNPLQQSGTLTEGQLQYMLNGELYINVQTRKYKDGEIRGQLQRRPDQPVGTLGSK